MVSEFWSTNFSLLHLFWPKHTHTHTHTRTHKRRLTAVQDYQCQLVKKKPSPAHSLGRRKIRTDTVWLDGHKILSARNAIK